jgi:ABC-2 type transport system ATP-binding protein
MDELRGRAPASIHTLRTSNDADALQLAKLRTDLTASRSADGGSLEVTADLPALDGYVVALGRAGIAIRRLEQRASSLESLFLQLTAESRPAGSDVDAPAAAGTRELS